MIHVYYYTHTPSPHPTIPPPHTAKKQTVSRLARVVLAGGLLAPFDPAMFKEKHLSAQQQREFSQPFRHLDLLLAQVWTCMWVCVYIYTFGVSYIYIYWRR